MNIGIDFNEILTDKQKLEIQQLYFERLKENISSFKLSDDDVSRITDAILDQITCSDIIEDEITNKLFDDLLEQLKNKLIKAFH